MIIITSCLSFVIFLSINEIYYLISFCLFTHKATISNKMIGWPRWLRRTTRKQEIVSSILSGNIYSFSVNNFCQPIIRWELRKICLDMRIIHKYFCRFCDHKNLLTQTNFSLHHNAKGPGLSSLHPIFVPWRSFFQQCCVSFKDALNVKMLKERFQISLFTLFQLWT